MRPIRSGDRGPAVEDVQRRLLTLGFDLGRTGVDGVFLGRTFDAVRAFQQAQGLDEDGLVGGETWAALVDATFLLGDRVLYLRLPHFHGRDIRVLQEALSALGFACGVPDGIFGAFTEGAVREFQRNAGLAPDGIVGAETARALGSLRHVWEGKEPRSHSAAHKGPARAADVLTRIRVAVCGMDSAGADVAERVCNLALATTDTAGIVVLHDADAIVDEFDAVLYLSEVGTESALPDRPIIAMRELAALRTRLSESPSSQAGVGPQVLVEMGSGTGDDDARLQRAAVRILDAVCGAFDLE